MRLLNIEHNIEFTLALVNIDTTFSKYLSSVSTKLWMNSRKAISFWISQIWYFLFNGDTDNEEQTGVAPINDLIASVLDKWAQWLVSGDAFSDELALKGGALLDGHLVVVLGNAGLSLFVDHQKELDHVLLKEYIHVKLECADFAQRR